MSTEKTKRSQINPKLFRPEIIKEIKEKASSTLIEEVHCFDRKGEPCEDIESFKGATFTFIDGESFEVSRREVLIGLRNLEIQIVPRFESNN